MIYSTVFSFDFVFCCDVQNGLVGCFGLNEPLRVISVYIGPSPREREKEERNDRWKKNVEIIPTRTFCKHSRPLPYYSIHGSKVVSFWYVKFVNQSHKH